MPQESMTPKERWLAVLQRKTPDRVPMDYWGTNEVMDTLMRHLGCSDPWDVYRTLHIDRVHSVRPRYAGPALPDDYDVLGCGFRDISYGTGVYRECVFHPLAHSAGAYVFYHSDGSIRPILPDMIAAGIDILNPIQWRCRGMEREALKQDLGDQVILHGGVDNQFTLPFGSVDEVRAEVLENLAVLGKGGGYILAPCHNIQAVSPAENIVAMYETCYAAGWT